MDSRLVDLEIKLTHQERLVATLNDIVTKQQDVIDALTQRLERVEGQLLDKGGDRADPASEPPPPHY
ncbi:MAG: SlyX family protein [Acidobacteriota bacterium]